MISVRLKTCPYLLVLTVTHKQRTLGLMGCFRNYGVKQNIQRDFQWV